MITRGGNRGDMNKKRGIEVVFLDILLIPLFLISLAMHSTKEVFCFYSRDDGTYYRTAVGPAKTSKLGVLGDELDSHHVVKGC